MAAAVFAVAPGLSLGARFAGLVVWLFGAALMSLVTARRLGSLQIGTSIVFRRWNLRIERRLQDAVAVRIQRPRIPIRSATEYALVVRVPGRKDVALPFAEHWLSGASATARARTVAERLGVPVLDPTGERWRASPVFLLRWVGRGEEWKVALSVAVGSGAVAWAIGG